jgi:hypothetical protein
MRVRRHVFKALLVVAVAAGVFLGAGLSHSRPAAALSLPAPVVASSADFCDKQANGVMGFLGLEPWYHFMPDSEFGRQGDPCAIKCFNIFPQHADNECGQSASDVPGVVLAIIDDLLRIAALVAVVYIIIGSFEFVGSRGNSERAASAQSTIISALTGLAISLVAVALVSFLGARLQ